MSDTKKILEQYKNNEISLEEIYEAIRQTMPKRLHEKNIAAVKAAFEEVVA